MAIEKVLAAPEVIRQARVPVPTRASVGPTNASRWTLRTPFAALLTLVTVGSDVMAEADRLRRDAERRWPHINFDT